MSGSRFVDAKEFSRDALDLKLKPYVVYAAAMFVTNGMHSDQQETFAAVEVEGLKEVMISTEYTDFANVIFGRRSQSTFLTL